MEFPAQSSPQKSRRCRQPDRWVTRYGQISLGRSFPWQHRTQHVASMIWLPGTDTTLDSTFPATIAQLSWQGRLHGMPWLVHAGWSGLFVNEQLWLQAGQPVPDAEWTYDGKFLDAAKRLTTGAGTDQAVFGTEIPYTIQPALTFIRSWGGDLLSTDGKKSQATDVKVLDALTVMHDLMNVHKVAPRPDQAKPGMFTAKTVASRCDGAFSIAGFRKDIAEGFKWRAYSMPKGPGGRGVVPRLRRGKHRCRVEIARRNVEVVAASRDQAGRPSGLQGSWVTGRKA